MVLGCFGPPRISKDFEGFRRISKDFKGFRKGFSMVFLNILRDFYLQKTPESSEFD